MYESTGPGTSHLSRWIATGLDANTKSFDWTIPQDLQAGSKYFVLICQNSGGTCGSWQLSSELFTVIAFPLKLSFGESCVAQLQAFNIGFSANASLLDAKNGLQLTVRNPLDVRYPFPFSICTTI